MANVKTIERLEERIEIMEKELKLLKEELVKLKNEENAVEEVSEFNEDGEYTEEAWEKIMSVDIEDILKDANASVKFIDLAGYHKVVAIWEDINDIHFYYYDEQEVKQNYHEFGKDWFKHLIGERLWSTNKSNGKRYVTFSGEVYFEEEIKELLLSDTLDIEDIVKESGLQVKTIDGYIAVWKDIDDISIYGNDGYTIKNIKESYEFYGKDWYKHNVSGVHTWSTYKGGKHKGEDYVQLGSRKRTKEMIQQMLLEK